MDWIKCKDRMPEEHPSIFSKMKKNGNKYYDSFYRANSEDVLVTYEFEDGSRDVGIANTHDGEWHSDTIRFLKAGNRPVKVISWMPYPSPDNN